MIIRPTIDPVVRPIAQVIGGGDLPWEDGGAPPSVPQTLEAQIIAAYSAVSWTTQLILLARAADVDAAAVGTWTDRSGNGRNATQGTAGAKPAFSATSLNSQGGITFDGGDLLSCAAVDLSTQTAVVVHAVFLDTTGALAMVFERSTGAGGADGGFYLDVNETAGSLRFFGRAAGANSSANSNAETMAAAHVITGTWDQALATNETSIRKDGVDDTASRPENANTSGGFGNHALFIGGRSGGSLPFTGTIGAIVVATGTSAIPSAAVSAVEALLKAQWGTP